MRAWLSGRVIQVQANRLRTEGKEGEEAVAVGESGTVSAHANVNNHEHQNPDFWGESGYHGNPSLWDPRRKEI